MFTPSEVDAWLHRPVLVEEKLDGANVVVWAHDGQIDCALRSGPGSQDRAGQLGPLRAWLGARTEELHTLFSAAALYGEWLLVTHAVPYDRLPAYLVGLDLLGADGAFMEVDDRNDLLASLGIPAPPELYRGVVETMATLESLLGQSAVGSEPMEGIVVRGLDGREPRLAKLLRSDFHVLDDTLWKAGRPRNQLADREASWR